MTPLENPNKFNILKQTPIFEPIHDGSRLQNRQTNPDNPDESLSRALKRKFIELDEITQRLRLRLSDVTKDEFVTANDDFADEFERDINTLCVEDDYDTVDLQMETDSYNGRAEDGVGLLQLRDGDVSRENCCKERGSDGVLLLDVLEGLSKQTRSDFDKQMLEGEELFVYLLLVVSLKLKNFI